MAALVLRHNLFPLGDKRPWHMGSAPFTASVINLVFRRLGPPDSMRLAHPCALLFMAFIESFVKL